eukprot:TRINITY_DN66920_c2_g2_i3.p1 TRINITY_DN66920_c2_g2~~TRINITY_DN66920_c2_g2_i3.p1  ORF type:complete len:626 (+),score=71.52 TRINITY_DN66920_c2_g2_i3:62-1939(+)
MSSSESFQKGLEHFHRGEFVSALVQGSRAIQNPDHEPAAHGLVGTCELYLRERTPSPIPEVKRSQTYSDLNTSPRWAPTVDAYRSTLADGPEVSLRTPNLHPEPSYDDFEYARRYREAERRMAEEERMAREAAEREQRRRDAEMAEAESRAAEEARLQREAEMRARMRQTQEEDDRRRALRDAEDRVKAVERERDNAVAELGGLQGAVLRDRDQYQSQLRQQTSRIQDLERQLRDARDDLDRERAENSRIDPALLEKLQRDVDNATATLNKQGTEFEAERRALLSDRDALASRQRPLEQQIDSLQLEVQRLNHLQTLTQTEHERNLADLKQRHAAEKLGLETDFNAMRALTADREALQRDLDRERAERDRDAQERARLVRDRDDLTRNLHHSEDTRQDLADRLANAERRIGQLESELANMTDAERYAREEARRLQNDELPRRVQEMTDQMTSQKEHYSLTIRELEANLSRTQADYNDQVAQLNNQLSDAHMRHNALAKENNDLKTVLNERERTIDGLQSLVDRLKGVEERLTAQESAHHRERQLLERDLDDSNKRFEDLAALLDNWKRERYSYDQRTDQLITLAARTPSPRKRPPSPMGSSGGYSPEQYSPGLQLSPNKSEMGVH